jgi:hypothetical protein
MATFSGLRGVPLLALSHNALFPALRIGPLGVVIRVIRNHELRYDEIETITLTRMLGFQVRFVPRAGLRTFIANFAGEAAVVPVLAALRRHGAPLDRAALARLAAGESSAA